MGDIIGDMLSKLLEVLGDEVSKREGKEGRFHSLIGSKVMVLSLESSVCSHDDSEVVCSKLKFQVVPLDSSLSLCLTDSQSSSSPRPSILRALRRLWLSASPRARSSSTGRGSSRVGPQSWIFGWGWREGWVWTEGSGSC